MISPSSAMNSKDVNKMDHLHPFDELPSTVTTPTTTRFSREAPPSLFDDNYEPQFSPINLNVNGHANDDRNDKLLRSRPQRQRSFQEQDENAASISASSHRSFNRKMSPMTRENENSSDVNVNVCLNVSNRSTISEVREHLEQGDGQDQVPVEEQQEQQESAEERQLREEAESEALARQLMAEEAMASYQQSTNYLQNNEAQYNDEDLEAIRRLMAEENPMQEMTMGGGEEELMDSDEMTYENLLNLGERIGDVKTERWAMRAENEISKLSCVKFKSKMSEGKDPNDCCAKCLICQFSYEEDESIRILPCNHYFHKECIDQWLMTKDVCPYCRQCVSS